MIGKNIYICFLLVWGGITTVGTAQTPFKDLTKKFESGQVFYADFTHHYEDSYTGEESTKSGDIWIGKTEYKIESQDQRVAVNGEISRVYDRQRNRLIISKYEPQEDDFAPSRILNGVDSTYTIQTQEKRGNNYFIELSSDDPFALFEQVNITLDPNGIPVKIFVRDPADNLITTIFSDGKFISREPGMFELNYPADANVIDMRE